MNVQKIPLHLIGDKLFFTFARRVKEFLINRKISGVQRFLISKKIIAGLVILSQNNLMQRLGIAERPAGLEFKRASASVKF
ncbi:MAG: hypothetical protein L3J53_06385 [Proteobacteria bacterium]|nr:hypothetical protein [Pseudomonadota bacterium]